MSAMEEEEIRSRPVFSLVPLARILAGQRHVPVVYFAQMAPAQGSEIVKIGTSMNLRSRMRDLYVPLENVLAIVPGDREVETGYHRLFAEYQVSYRQRELFRLEGRLKRFLGSQTEGVREGLPASAPTQPAPALAPLVLVPDLAAPMTLLEIVRVFILPNCGNEEQKRFRAKLHSDRHRSDRGELPEGLRFPEPVQVEGPKRTEKFAPLAVIRFNNARRGVKAS